jgi:hypothetical protein
MTGSGGGVGGENEHFFRYLGILIGLTCGPPVHISKWVLFFATSTL